MAMGEVRHINPHAHTPKLADGGGGGDNTDMDARIKALETAMTSVSERLGRVETRLSQIDTHLGHMPTKADLSDTVHTQTKWVIGIGFALMMFGIALAKLI